MVAWPANGETNWNDKMKEFVDVSHEADGTVKAAAVAAAALAAFTPTSVGSTTGRVIFPNGLHIKWGYISGNGEKAVDFGAIPFSTGCVPNVQLTDFDAAGTTGDGNSRIRARDKDGFTCWINTSMDGAMWMAIGY